MATKSKRDDQRGLRPLLLLLAITLAATMLLLVMRVVTRRYERSIYEQEFFSRDISDYSGVLYWEMLMQQTGMLLEPVEVFFPVIAKELGAGEPQREWDDEGNPLQPEEYERSQNLLSFVNNFNERMQSRRDSFHSEWDNLSYVVLDEKGPVLGGGDTLVQLAEGGDVSAEQIYVKYDFCMVIRYDSAGRASTPVIYGVADANQLINLRGSSLGQEWTDLLDSHNIPRDVREMTTPRDMTVVFAVPNVVSGYNRIIYDQRVNMLESFNSSGYSLTFMVLMGIAALFGFMTSKRGYPYCRQAARLPFEAAAVLGVLLPLSFKEAAALAFIAAGDGRFTARNSLAILSGWAAFGVGVVLGGLLLTVSVLSVYMASLSLFQSRTMGLQTYLREKSYLYRLLGWCGTWLHRFYRWLTDIDLSEKGSKSLGRVLTANFVIVAILCAMWVFGVFFLVLYTLLLFYMIRRYTNEIKRHYNSVLFAARGMAEGRLNVQLDEELGLFQPLGDELRQAQDGFRDAVESEVKSQRMKTELITNVSHDLKTPLTAIITYVNLLKNENLTPEERRSYVETLDMKSQRLKRLIDDLFEMSKANSGDVAMRPALLDLCALLRQVAAESAGDLETAGIDLRLGLPVNPVLVRLDGERTSRIFENLLLNIVKYALPGTRAYLSILTDPDTVAVELKNISRDALDYDVSDLTDRFVRGDPSRKTEGSGLGLAIAKSFADAQDGSLVITTDGDLFKTTVTFPRVREVTEKL